MKRSNQKRITKEAIILRHMRHLAELSLNEAGKLLSITGSAIAHIEQGRMDVSRFRVESMVKAYGFTMEAFLDLLDEEVLPVDLKQECIAIIRLLDETKLQAAFAVLSNFLPPGSSRVLNTPRPQSKRLTKVNNLVNLERKTI